MRLPAGFMLVRVLSPGPVAVVALGRGPDGAPCVLKEAAIARGAGALETEAAMLRALERAEVAGVPRLLAEWPGGIAMERLESPTLGERADAMRAEATFRVAVARAAFERLAAVHAAEDERGALEIVHGDVSPGNLYVSGRGVHVAIADFGLARGRDVDPPEGGAFRGTLPYVAPEVARGEPFDARADDFALAASLLHVATGVPLRDPESAPPVMLARAGTRPLDASHPWRGMARNLFDPAVADALVACLAFDPRDRPRRTPRPC